MVKIYKIQEKSAFRCEIIVEQYFTLEKQFEISTTTNAVEVLKYE
jgi:hypothetical protein